MPCWGRAAPPKTIHTEAQAGVLPCQPPPFRYRVLRRRVLFGRAVYSYGSSFVACAFRSGLVFLSHQVVPDVLGVTGEGLHVSDDGNRRFGLHGRTHRHEGHVDQTTGSPAVNSPAVNTPARRPAGWCEGVAAAGVKIGAGMVRHPHWMWGGGSGRRRRVKAKGVSRKTVSAACHISSPAAAPHTSPAAPPTCPAAPPTCRAAPPTCPPASATTCPAAAAPAAAPAARPALPASAAPAACPCRPLPTGIGAAFFSLSASAATPLSAVASVQTGLAAAAHTAITNGSTCAAHAASPAGTTATARSPGPPPDAAPAPPAAAAWPLPRGRRRRDGRRRAHCRRDPIRLLPASAAAGLGHAAQLQQRRILQRAVCSLCMTRATLRLAGAHGAVLCVRQGCLPRSSICAKVGAVQRDQADEEQIGRGPPRHGGAGHRQGVQIYKRSGGEFCCC